MRHHVVFWESENFLFFQRFFMVNRTHCRSYIFMNTTDSGGLNHIHIFKIERAQRSDICFEWIIPDSSRCITQAGENCPQPCYRSSLSTLSRSWHTNLFFSKPARQQLTVFRESKSLNDNFQMNIGRVNLFPLICHINLSLRAQGLHILIENICFPVLTALVFLSLWLLLTEIFQF